MPYPKSPAAIDAETATLAAYHKAHGLPPYKPRLIDMVEGQRTRPMRVLCLGFSRTGTISLLAALNELGYHPYHMAEALKDASMDFPLWEEALKAKFLGQGKLWGKEEFDKMLGRFDGCEDVPCILFAEELINMYPEAKVILTHRPATGMSSSLIEYVQILMLCPRLGPLDPAHPWRHLFLAMGPLRLGRQHAHAPMAQIPRRPDRMPSVGQR